MIYLSSGIKDANIFFLNDLKRESELSKTKQKNIYSRQSANLLYVYILLEIKTEYYEAI